MKRALPLLLLALTACGSKSIEGVQTFTYAGGDHRSGSLIYAENPPAGGPHNPMWQNCGVYDRPLYNEYAVHSLEHGAVWITYRPDLDATQVAALKKLVEGHILHRCRNGAPLFSFICCMQSNVFIRYD